MRAPRAAVRAWISAVLVVAAGILSAPATAAGSPPEDTAGFDCRIHGNRVCGTGNDQRVPAGRYWDCGAGLCRAETLPPELCRALWSGAVFPAVAVARLGGR